MKNKIKSVSKILNFFQKLDTYKNNRIFVYTDKQSALDQANICDQRQNTLSKIDGSLVAVKPNLKVKSFPFSGGIEEFKNIISEFDDPIIKIIKNNGGIIIGLTNMDEAAFGGDTSSSFFGRCLNPINEKLSVGGSSGGSAAAISSGLVNYALGTDTMGSVRIPASYCGIVGFKPSSLIFNNKELKLLSHSYDTIGLMGKNTKYIRDLFELTKSSHKNKINKNEDTKNIKCFIPKQVFENELNQDVFSGFKYIISKIKKNNILIEIDYINYWKINKHRRALLKIVENEGALNLEKLLENEQSKISKSLRKNLLYGKNLDKKEIKQIKQDLKLLKNQITTLLENYDLIIMPTTPQTAFNIEKETPENQANLTSVANICDLPSISLPYYHKGISPHSLQLITSNMNDKFLLRMSSVFEKILQ